MSPPPDPVVGGQPPPAEQLLTAERDPATGRLVNPRPTGDRNGKGRRGRSRWARIGVPVLALLLVAGIGTAVLAGGGGDSGPEPTVVPTTALEDVQLAGVWKINWEFVSARNPVSPTPLSPLPEDSKTKWRFRGACDGAGPCTLVDAAGNRLQLEPSGGGYTFEHTASEVPPNCDTTQSISTHTRMTLSVSDGRITGRWVGGPDVWQIDNADGSPCYLFEHTHEITGTPVRR